MLENTTNLQFLFNLSILHFYSLIFWPPLLWLHVQYMYRPTNPLQPTSLVHSPSLLWTINSTTLVLCPFPLWLILTTKGDISIVYHSYTVDKQTGKITTQNYQLIEIINKRVNTALNPLIVKLILMFNNIEDT